MLDVITDFWKPVKKAAPQEKPDLENLQVGSSIEFGTVPQALLSGQSFTVSVINTYQFGPERMTSFVLSQEKDDMVSMIVANAEGEQYLAISRRIPFADRMKMFDMADVDALFTHAETNRLQTLAADNNWKHWLVGQYKKEISGVRGAFTRGDFRNQPVPPVSASQPFDYVLLTSDNNEYAIEIEKYADARIELYATIYRRVSDILSIQKPKTAEALSAPAVAARTEPVLEIVRKEEPVSSSEPEKEPSISSAPSETAEVASFSTMELEEEQPEELLAEETLAEEESWPEEPEVEEEPLEETPTITETPTQPTEKEPMAFNAPSAANFPNGTKSSEIKTLSRSSGDLENEAIECDLRVANKIIEEAIRNEMRLSDVVRRVIALPVANPESVQIPITLTDSDYQLLAIRYGMNANDKNAIKTKIIEELNDFSGAKKQ